MSEYKANNVKSILNKFDSRHLPISKHNNRHTTRQSLKCEHKRNKHKCVECENNRIKEEYIISTIILGNNKNNNIEIEYLGSDYDTCSSSDEKPILIH